MYRELIHEGNSTMFSAATKLSLELIKEMELDEYEITEEGLVITEKDQTINVPKPLAF